MEGPPSLAEVKKREVPSSLARHSASASVTEVMCPKSVLLATMTQGKFGVVLAVASAAWSGCRKEKLARSVTLNTSRNPSPQRARPSLRAPSACPAVSRMSITATSSSTTVWCLYAASRVGSYSQMNRPVRKRTTKADLPTAG